MRSNLDIAVIINTLDSSAKDIAKIRLAKRLSDDDWRVRESAVRALGAIGGAVGPLIAEQLSDDDWRVRRAAALALGALGTAAAEQASLIVERLSDDRPSVRKAAIQALGAMGAAVGEQAPRIAERLNDDNWTVREAAAQALGAMGAAAAEQAPLIVQRFGDVDSGVRRAATQALGIIGTATAAQATLIAERLSHHNQNVREAAVLALGAMGTAEQAPLIAERLNDSHWNVRLAAVQVLGTMGAEASEQASLIAERLSDDDTGVREAAAQALGAMGAAAGEQVPLLAERLSDDDWTVREAAALALGAMGAAAREQAPLIAERLSDTDPDVREAAVQALGAIGAAASEQAPNIAERFSELNQDVREAAALALGAIGAADGEQAQLITVRLTDDNWMVREAAAQALGAMGVAAAEQAPLIVERLSDDSPSVRRAAVQTLGAMGVEASEQAPLIAERLSDIDWRVRKAAVFALGAMGAAAGEQAPLIAEQLGDSDSDVRWAAVQALGAMGATAKEQSPILAQSLSDSSGIVRAATFQSLIKMGPHDISLLPGILSHGYNNRSYNSEMRFTAHFLMGDNNEAQIILAWLGVRNKEWRPDPPSSLNESRRIIRLFRDFWPYTREFPNVRDDLAEQIEHQIRNVNWEITDVPLLIQHRDNIESVHPALVASINAAIIRARGFEWAKWAARAAALHGAFWIVLIFAYPRFRPVQAIFFWNPWVRRIAGLGYVGFLLAWIPFLRRRLFAPFGDMLLADAYLRDFNDQNYFPTSNVLAKRTGKTSPITQALSKLDGQIVLEGESGLGKTMFVRHMLKNNDKLSVMLDAKHCGDGVIAAIQRKLEGPAKDPAYLRSIIFAGALDVVIDGLNEVSAETRASISEFAKSFSKGNLLVTTQPMQWSPPPLAEIYILQPLFDEQIYAFLSSRGRSLPDGDANSFEQLCKDFLEESLGSDVSQTESEEYRNILSNPMDLDVVSQMLAQDKKPDLLQLQEQYFQLMADDFRQHHQNKAFPIKDFSDCVYEMRCDDRDTFRPDEFPDELITMAEHRMVIPRHSAVQEADAAPLWTFRHDKIMDYFLVQAFLGEDNPRPKRHLGDARFRGAYLLMARLLPVDEAQKLREMLINHAADTKDHSISDSFIQLLRSRTASTLAFQP